MYSVCIYTLLKVVSYYDLSVLSTSVMGFQKKFGWGWWPGWVGVSSIQVYFGFFEFFKLCKAPYLTSRYNTVPNHEDLFIASNSQQSVTPMNDILKNLINITHSLHNNSSNFSMDTE